MNTCVRVCAYVCVMVQGAKLKASSLALGGAAIGAVIAGPLGLAVGAAVSGIAAGVGALAVGAGVGGGLGYLGGQAAGARVSKQCDERGEGERSWEG